MGNICRSPTAEGVFRQLVRDAGLDTRIETDSAGMIRYHQGNPPDARATAAAKKRGIDIGDLRARQVVPDDFVHFDHVIAMDEENLRFLEENSNERYHERMRLLLDFAEGVDEKEVPDPYYGGDSGFEHVLDLVDVGARGLLAHIREHDL